MSWQENKYSWFKEYDRKSRKDFPEKWILWEVRSWDKHKGFTCNLTEVGIKNLISLGCIYCGETKLRMTLDRIDNLKGHSEDNVIPACIRCNLLRKDMPYEAWLELSPGLRTAREKGLFGNWTGCLKTPVQQKV